MANKVVKVLKATMLYRLLRTTRPDLFFKRYPDAYAHLPQEEKKRIRRKMNRAHLRYGLSYQDFWRCRCENKNWDEIRAILPYQQQKAFWMQINSPEARVLLDEKWKTYQRFGRYYHRDVTLVAPTEQGAADLATFTARHSRFLVKPLNQRLGKGIRIVGEGDAGDGGKALLAAYPDGFLAEEIIVQDSALGQFHPESVNTLRINTFSGPDGPVVKWPCLRMGRGSSIVDNAGAGGIFGAIDVQTGRIIGVSDEKHNLYAVHPDTGIPLIGYRMPRWDEACALVKELAEQIPEARFVGWDLALTPNGWVLVEGNYCPLLIWQFAADRGIKPEFEQMKKAYEESR